MGESVFCHSLICPPTTVSQRSFAQGTVSFSSQFNHLVAVTCSTLSHSFLKLMRVVLMTNTSLLA